MKILLIISVIFFNLFSQELISPIPKINDYDKKRALLGKKLFQDKRLSSNNTVSCSSCHMLNNGGDDNRRVSFGVDNKEGTFNAPTIFNVRFNLAQFWDGRAKNLQEQALGPIHNPVEMNSNFEEIIEKLNQDKIYKKDFLIYKNGITKENIIDAIVEFEKALVTPHSRFDRYILGEEDILTQDEKEGFDLFLELGCISCHNGVNIGGNLYQKMGVIKEYNNSQLFGRYEVTKKEKDKYFFKVPSLRNIEHTAPYFHDGKVNHLKKAIKIMIEYQVGMIANEEEIVKIEKFLKTLSGKLPEILVQK